ncbi:hypothetical protein PHYBLDRAFT_138768 [Phycomyces blakesleeanus NRRL 1555(-)]|uniref:Uncharacterized protein n=1 Tax=Phycomyces blakesleeanus (strain ATCC 8743b / DSM 1359 / FGSC 10004 / NBRC 33097 / NRRL 1555) TaxID=763407 RepID=A0A167RAE5_PHYB8|nr:hypothetical protein PHYBLDRAFT_138768 [Phycomyces blakesleeanus NRRL 1555(-)]OAD81219.1 hypothetical protein PHYBLDRAFT_138768 [Phycomyces blakesleeanus NRRL 1555(-)]|eukprot:XP_018299259.1 hypothetical protein PHYBLDRAFT_138768 [Phycomyces blakesleeanus NRRL 1555(-)]
MDWKTIKTLLHVDPWRLEEALEAGLVISSFPMSLCINYNDMQNVINDQLNELSRQNAVDRTSFHKGNDLSLLSWISPWQKKQIIEAADEWCIDSTHKTCKSLVGSGKHSYLYTIIIRSNIMNKSVPVCFFITNAELTSTLRQWLTLWL